MSSILVAAVAFSLNGCAGAKSIDPELQDVIDRAESAEMDERAQGECVRYSPDSPGLSELESAQDNTLGSAYAILADFDPEHADRSNLDSYGPATYVALCVFTGSAFTARIRGEHLLLYSSSVPTPYGGFDTPSQLMAYW